MPPNALATLLDAETVRSLSRITANDLRKRQRVNGHTLGQHEEEHIEEAVLDGLLDLVQSWSLCPSSLTGDKEAQQRKALKRMRWETPKYVDAIRAERRDLLTPAEVEALRAQPCTPEEPADMQETRRRRQKMAEWALSELPNRERQVLMALHGQAEAPSKRGLATELGISEGLVRKVERLAKEHFRDLLEPWLAVL